MVAQMPEMSATSAIAVFAGMLVCWNSEMSPKGDSAPGAVPADIPARGCPDVGNVGNIGFSGVCRHVGVLEIGNVGNSGVS